MNESRMFSRERAPKPSAESLPTKMSVEAGVEETRTNAYDTVGALRDRVRMNTNMVENEKLELLEQLHEIQKGLGNGTSDIEKALAEASTLAAKHELEF